MKLLVFVITILFVATGLTLLAVENPGYVLIARAPWSVEMPLTLFGLLVLVVMALFYLLLHGLARVWRIPRDVGRWRQLRHARRVQESLAQGLLHLSEGNWVQAEKRALSDLRFNENPLLNYLAAAFAAQGQGDIEKRNEYLSLAHQHGRGHDLAIGMTQAHLHSFSRQYEQALAILTQLRANYPQHPQTLRLLAEVYRELRDWTSLANLIPELRRVKVYPPQELEALELQTSRELLTLSLPSGSMAVLEKAWRHVPDNLRRHPALVEIYARHLLKQRETVKAEVVLREAIAREWNENLVLLYGRVRMPNPAPQLETAESWLGAHGNSSALLLTLGRIANEGKLRGKAREYLERSLALRESPEAFAELAAVLEESGQSERAREHYQRGLRLCTGEEAPMPARTGARAGQEDVSLRR